MNNELEHIAPHLQKLSNQKQGFKVPYGYFDALQQSLEQQQFLAKLPLTSGFQVPEDYFNQVETHVWKQFSIQNPKKANMYRFVKVVSSVAAVAFIAFGITQYIRDSQSDISMDSLAEYSTTQVNHYELAAMYADELNQLDVHEFLDPHEVESYLETNADLSLYYE